MDRLNNFSEHVRLLILSQEEVLLELEEIINIIVLCNFSCEFLSQPVNKNSCDLVHDMTVCVTINCRVKDE